MKPLLKLSSLILLAALVFLPARVASASAGVFEGQVIFGQSYTLAAGETLPGDLLVFGGTAEIQEDAIVQGNVVLFGGGLTVDGEVTGTADPGRRLAEPRRHLPLGGRRERRERDLNPRGGFRHLHALQACALDRAMRSLQEWQECRAR